MPSKVAFITGASKGIGRAVALEAAACGLDLIITARNKTELNNLAKEIESKDQQCYIFKADLNQLSEIKNLLHEVDQINRQISLLVHSAGVAKVGLVKDMSIEDWYLNLNSNLTAPFLLTQKLLPAMDKNSQIIFINSVGGRQSFAEWSSYCASKFGLKAFADSLRQEISGDGIRVTTIYPASVNTPMQDSLPYDWDRSKMLHAEDVARAVMYCYNQPKSVLIKELDMENNAGVF